MPISIYSLPAGSALWMAPEILLGDVFNEKVDVFSYAMCLVELIDCHLPWHGVAVGAAITIKVTQGQRPEAQVNGDRAREMGALVQVRFGPQMIQVGPYHTILDTKILRY